MHRNYMNDSLRTNLFVRFPPETIACACIFLAARELKVRACTCVIVPTDAELPEYSSVPLSLTQIPLCQSPPWWLVFDANYEDIEVQLQSHTHVHVYTISAPIMHPVL